MVAACLFSLLATALMLVLIARAADVGAIPIIDCRVHLWDIARSAGLGWIRKDDKTLNRSFLPGDHELFARANGDLEMSRKKLDQLGAIKQFIV